MEIMGRIRKGTGMSTASDVLKWLRQKGGPVSGESLSTRLGVSRAAIWKAVDSLRDQGHAIEGISGRGYRVLAEGEQLSAAAIESRLDQVWQGADVRVYKELASTNSLAKSLVGGGKRNIIAADSQTAGRGRRGRPFHSPAGAGLYFSLAMEWNKEETPVLVTTMAATAVALVMERELGVFPGIKWVNDLFLDQRKICGILTEAVTGLESGITTSIVSGIGINLTEPEGGYPESIRGIAGAVLKEGRKLNKNSLIASIANELGDMIERLPDRTYLDHYRERCFILGQEVRLDTGETVIPRAVSDDGALIYTDDKGELRSLQRGEISIRL